MAKDRVAELVNLQIVAEGWGYPIDQDTFLDALVAEDFERFDKMHRRAYIEIAQQVLPAMYERARASILATHRHNQADAEAEARAEKEENND